MKRMGKRLEAAGAWGMLLLAGLGVLGLILLRIVLIAVVIAFPVYLVILVLQWTGVIG